MCVIRTLFPLVTTLYTLSLTHIHAHTLILIRSFTVGCFVVTTNFSIKNDDENMLCILISFDSLSICSVFVSRCFCLNKIMLAQPFVSALKHSESISYANIAFHRQPSKRTIWKFCSIVSSLCYRYELLSVYFPRSISLLLSIFFALNSLEFCTFVSIRWHSIDCQFLFNILSIKFNHSNMSEHWAYAKSY